MQITNVTLATKTLMAIDNAVEADQGSAYRGYLQKVLPHIGDAYRQGPEGFRSHLGGSVLGGSCGRAIWYGFRWVSKKTFPGRIQRLFNRGHLEEGRFIALLLSIGVQVYQQDENGKQFSITFANGHGGGSGDGVAIGVPDLPPNTPCLLEFKTHNDKSFKALESKGVREAKFEHYVQCQAYMRKMGLTVALYMAVNKNDDTLYAEIIQLNSEVADEMLARGEKIIWMQQPPEKINSSPAWYECKYCDYRPVCHLNAAPLRNCRTCVNGRAVENKMWECSARGSLLLDSKAQAEGCDKYSQMVV